MVQALSLPNLEDRTPVTPHCLTGLRLVETLQKAGQHCTRLNTARASSAGGALDVACSAQPEYTGTIQHVVSMPFGDLAEGLETPVQLIYLVTLLGFLVVGAYLVVRQVSLFQILQIPDTMLCCMLHAAVLCHSHCAGDHSDYSVGGTANDTTLEQCMMALQVLVRRELEEAAKVLGERIRTNDASPEVRATANVVHQGALWQACIPSHVPRRLLPALVGTAQGCSVFQVLSCMGWRLESITYPTARS